MTPIDQTGSPGLLQFSLLRFEIAEGRGQVLGIREESNDIDVLVADQVEPSAGEALDSANI